MSLCYVITQYMAQVEVFWVVMPCNLVEGYHCFGGTWCLPEDGDNRFLWNVGILSQHYMTSQPGRQLESSLPCELQNHNIANTFM